MKPEKLFLQRCNQIAILAQSRGELDALDIGGKLRQLLADKNSLVHTVNINRVKLLFNVGVMRPPRPPQKAYRVFALAGGIDPEGGAPNSQFITLNKDGFLKHRIAHYYGQDITVLDVIRYASNVAGSVHHDPNPAKEYLANVALAQLVSIKGMPTQIQQLRAIARVTLRAIDPLIADVRARA